MGKHYEQSIIPEELKRNFDVYDRLRDLDIELGTFEDQVRSLQGRNICSAVIHQGGTVYLSGIGLGDMQMNDEPEIVAHGQQAGAKCAEHHVRTLHWTLSCGGEGDLNDVLYTMKGIGMVVSTDVAFNSGPAVTNGYSKVWHDVFGGGIGKYAKEGMDSGGYAGVHARSAIGGFTGRFSLEPEMIVAIPPTLAEEIIRNRGWIYPLIPSAYEKISD
tara:strand:- start:580 stop:1227 length:648 start_codon:yes stop_codon:yes gene_type:complete